MNNKNISIELNEKYIKDLTILKLKRNYGFIEREEFRNELINLGINNGISDYAEMLTFIAFNVIVDRIEEMQGDDKVKLLFNEIVEVPYEEDFVSKSCDVVLLGKDVIALGRILPDSGLEAVRAAMVSQADKEQKKIREKLELMIGKR